MLGGFLHIRQKNICKTQPLITLLQKTFNKPVVVTNETNNCTLSGLTFAVGNAIKLKKYIPLSSQYECELSMGEIRKGNEIVGYEKIEW